MPVSVEIPEIGEVEFPDSMTEADIAAASSNLYGQRKGVPPAAQPLAISPPPPDTPEGRRLAAALEEAPESGVRTLGRGISALGRYGGRVAMGAAQDIGALLQRGPAGIGESQTLAALAGGIPSGAPEALSAEGTTAAGEPPKPLGERIAVGAISGVGEMAPALAGAAVTGGATLPAWFAGQMGLSAYGETGDPGLATRQAAIGALMGQFSRYGSAIGEAAGLRAAAKLPAALENATIEAGKFAGQQAALNYLMTAGNLPELMQEPDKAIDRLAEQVGINLAFAAPHLPEQARRAFSRDWAEQMVRSPEYRATLDEAARLGGQPVIQLGITRPTILETQKETAEAAQLLRRGFEPTRQREKPTVPETPAQAYQTAIQEVRGANARTIGEIQRLFSQRGLSREEARAFRNAAWGTPAEERLAPQTTAAIREPVTPTEAPKAPETVPGVSEPLPAPETAPTAPQRPAAGVPANRFGADPPWLQELAQPENAAIARLWNIYQSTGSENARYFFSGGGQRGLVSGLESVRELVQDYPSQLKKALADEPKPTPVIPEQPVKAGEAVPQAQAVVSEIARTEGRRSAQDIKDELVAEIQNRLQKAPSEAVVGDTVTIEIPDDGTFIIPNTVEALSEVLKRAKAIKIKEKPPGVPRAARGLPRKGGALKPFTYEETALVPEQAPLAPEPATPITKEAAPVLEPAISFPGIGSLREKQATAMELGKIRKAEPELWKAITQMFGTDQPAKIAKAAKARMEQLRRPEGSVGPGAASVEDPAFMRPPARLDFGNMARSALQSVVNGFRTKARQQLPELPSVSGEFLPDLGNRQQNKVIASEPTGIGRVPILGWLLDPRQRARTPEEISILTWFHENAMGQAHVQALGSTFGTHFKRLFPRNEKGEFTTVGRTSSAQSMHPSDVFEGLQRDPKSYVLSPEQRAAFEELMTYEQKARELSKKYKLRFDEETGEFVEGSEGQQPYWTRGRVLKPGSEKRAVGGTMLGARQYFQKGRTFKTEQEGVEAGYEYPLNVDDRFLMRAGRLYKAIADRRLAKDPDLGGRWGGTPKYEESYVFQPAFQRRFAVETAEGPQAVVQHKIFPLSTANKLNRAFGPHGSIIRKMVVSANNFLKGLTLGFDWGVAQIQGLTTAYKNPAIWADAQVKALKAFVNRDVFAQYVRNNLEPVREYAQFGGSVGRLPEMMAGLERGEILTGVPRMAGRTLERRGFERTGKAIAAIAEVPEAFGRQFQTFLDVAKIELWKARREVVPREEWAREIQAIESQLQSGRMESIGVRPNQALVERMLLLAPSYYRGALNLIAGLAERGSSGQTYRRAMGAYMLGTTATFVALGLAAGMTWDEIRRRLNPSRGDFLMVPVKTGNRTVNVGFGGINRSLMRLAGETAETSIEQPGNWKSLSPEKNPFVRWFRAHAAPIPATTWDAFSGRDYMGDETDIQSLGKRAVPLAIQELFAKQKTPRTPVGVAAEVAASLTGLTAFPGRTAKQEISSLHREWLQKHPDEAVRADFKRAQEARYPVSKYNDLDQALIDRDEKKMQEAVAELERVGIDLKDIKQRLNPRTKEGRIKTLFHEKRNLERDFEDSLTAEEQQKLEAAIDERDAQWDFFRRYF